MNKSLGFFILLLLCCIVTWKGGEWNFSLASALTSNRGLKEGKNRGQKENNVAAPLGELGRLLIRAEEEIASLAKLEPWKSDCYNYKPLQERKHDWNLPEWGAKTWCEPPQLPPFDFLSCNHTDTVYIIPLVGGLTNALKLILLGSIKALEENKCFTIDESVGHLFQRKERRNQFDSILQRYFEPMGLPYDHEIIQTAIKHNRTKVMDMWDILNDENALRVYGSRHYMPKIVAGEPLEGHFLKRVVMRRLWRPLPYVRREACRSLERSGLGKAFIAFGVRRGDKYTVEHFELQNLNAYLRRADQDVHEYFHDEMPKIWVSTDDCRVMKDFRFHRPEMTFLSECDHAKKHLSVADGFALSDVSNWSRKQTDLHFRKFFVELYALAISPVFIGVGYTNVAWWAYFMRPDRHSFHLLDQKHEGTVDHW